MDQNNEILGLVCLIASLCAFIFSLIYVVRTKRFIRRSAEVDGKVIRLERDEDRGGTTHYVCYAPVFSFTVADGNTYTVTSKISSSPADFSVGDSVRVRYDPANPTDARIHTFFETWGAAVIFGLVGLIFVFISCKLFGVIHLSK